MTVVTHHSEGRDGEQPWPIVILKAILTVLLVAIVVAAALGGATYVVSRALVHLLS